MILLVFNNVSFTILIVACWWLAHSYSNARHVWIAVFLALSGFSTLATLLARNASSIPAWSVPWLIVGTKVFIAMEFMSMALNRACVDAVMHRLDHARPPSPTVIRND